MENVSHNTSFDSADDNLSRASNQQPFDHHGEQEAGAYVQSHPQQPENFQQEMVFTGSGVASLPDTEQNDYGFPSSTSHPNAHMINPQNNNDEWENGSFDRQHLAQQQHQDPLAEVSDNQQYNSNQEHNQEELSDHNLSRPTAVFGNQGGTMNYPEENQAEEESSYIAKDDKITEQYPYPQEENWSEAQDNRIMMTEDRGNNQHYQEEFNQRFYPNGQLGEKLRSQGQPSRLSATTDQTLEVLTNQRGPPMQQDAHNMSKRSAKKSDFIQQSENITVNNSFQSSKESILQSLRNQSRQEKNLDSFTSERHMSNTHSRAQSNLQQQWQMAPQQQRAEQVVDGGSIRRNSFPNSESEAPGNETVADIKLQGQVVALLRIKLSQRGRVDVLAKKLAFEKLVLNRQNAFMEQLLTDNEALLDQLQNLQQSNQNLSDDQSSRTAAKEQINQGVFQLYNDEVIGSQPRSQQRNNSKSDQTHPNGATYDQQQQHTRQTLPSMQTNNGLEQQNSANKESSPNLNIKQADSAFMRAMLREDSTSQVASPFHNQPSSTRPINILDEEMKAFSTDSSFFEEFSQSLKTIVNQCHSAMTTNDQTAAQIKSKLHELSHRFDSQAEKLRSQCLQLDQAKDLLQTKVQGVDRLELDNLELHMQLDAKLRALETLLRCGSDASKLFKFDHKRVHEGQTQTETVYNDILHKEASLQVFSKELSLVKLRQDEESDVKVKDLEKRECDLEIRERLIEEKRIEYSYKQKELNQRIKSQMTWPLNCLENDTKLLEKFKDFKLKPDHLKTLEADSNLSIFLQREENLALMQSFEGEMLAKCEGLLHYEYLLLKERAKNMVFHENAINELATLQTEGEELGRDRERYQLQAEFERGLQKESLRLDKTRTELTQIKENLFKLVSFLGDTLNGKLTSSGPGLQQSQSEFATPQTKVGTLPSNQLSLLLGNLQKSYSSQSEGMETAARIPPQINPYNQTINARDPSTLLQVVSDYRATDPMLNKLQTKDMQSLIESTIEHLESSSRIQNGSPDQTSQEMANLRQIRRMLVRDAYFLQKERQWLEQERLKLNSMMSRSHRRSQHTDKRTAQVQTSIERPNSQSAIREPDQQLLPMLHQQQPRSRVTNHGHKESVGNTSNVTLENVSIASQLDQDRKKIQLLHQNLSLEKEYNKDLNTQLTAQMELIKLQNEKLIEGENQINEMKLRLLIKFEQIKVLEEYYNRNHSEAYDEQIHLEIELDDEQLRQIVLQLNAKYHRINEQSKDGENVSNIMAIVRPKKQYREFWALNSVVGILRHLLMERCRYNPAQHRLQYAFMLFRAQTILESNDEKHRLSGTGQLNRLLQGNNSLNSSRLTDDDQLDLADHSLIEVKPMTEGISYIAEVQQIQVATNSVSIQTESENERAAPQKVDSVTALVQTDVLGVPVGTPDTDWSELYWKKNRHEILGYGQIQTVDQLSEAAGRLEQQVANFWKFKAKNTLRLMQLHSTRRRRMLHAFAFQRFKVQTMRATVQRLSSVQFQTSQMLMLDNQNSAQRTHQQTLIVSPGPPELATEMTTGKRHAIVLMLTLRNQKFSELREKNRALNKWRGAARDAQSFTLQSEIGRLASEVDTVRFNEEVLRTNFQMQRTELESKVNILVSLLQN